MSGLSKQEQKILDTFANAFKYLTEEEKARLYYLGLGMTIKGKKKSDKCEWV